MENFRKRSRDTRRQSIDSILNAPTRGQDARRPLGRQTRSFESLRPSGRRVGDFTRPEGYHVAPSNNVGTEEQQPMSKKEQAARAASMLHMTLPSGGGLNAGKKKRKNKEKNARNSRWRNIRRWTLRSALALSVLVLLVGGILVAKGLFKLNKVFKGGGSAAALEADVKPELLKGEGDGRVNILLFGKGGPGHEGPDLTDTLILASIDPVNKTSTLVSVPRDTWVSVPGYGSSKINAVYANAKYRSLNTSPKDKAKAEKAGIEATQGVVSQVLGVPVHYYAMIDFQAFKQAIDTVGGVTINVPADLVDPSVAWENNGSPVLARKGTQTMNGKQALLYVRSRHGSARGDFDRTERQRLVIAALSHKVLSAGTYANPIKISQLMSAFGDHVSTDLSVNNALRLMTIAKGMDMNQMKSIGLADPPNVLVQTDNMNGQSVIRPVAGYGNYAAIQNYIRNTLKDPYLAKENAVLNVLNGTGRGGLATRKADLLKSYGYNVTTVGDAPTKDYAKTQLIDMTNGKKPFTKNYLEKRLGVKATTRLPDPKIPTQGVDFVVILGQNEQ
jgi:LCP family protein required for cell wall assembly